MMKKMQMMLGLILVMAVLTGCSDYAKTYDKNTIVVNGNGSIVEIAVENFKDTSVTPENLEIYIMEQIESYNSGQEKDMVKSESLSVEDMSNVKLVLSYKDIETYNGFNLLECALDDFSEVGEDLEGTFTSIDGESVKVSEMENTKKAQVLVMSEATDVVVKGDILYYNEEVSVKDDVATTTGEENAIIIFK